MIGDIYIMSGINYYYTFPCNSHANAFMINSTGVLESTEEMKKTEILEKYGDVIKHYRTGEDSYYYFRIPDKTIKGGAFRRKKKSREQIEDALYKYYLAKEKEEKESSSKDKTTFEQLFYEFMEHKKEKVSAGTIRRMMIDWKKYYNTKQDFIHKPYKEITPIDIDDFLNGIVNTTEIKDKAFCNMCGILKQTFNYAVSARYISGNENPYRVEVNKKKIIPTRKKPSEEEVYNAEETQKLITEMKRRLQNNPANTSLLAIMLEFELGTRRGEILAVKDSDIANGEIHIHRQIVDVYDVSDLNNAKLKGYKAVEYTKSDAGDRYIPLTHKAMQYIKQIRQINSETGEYYQDFLFVQDGYLINPNKLYNIIKDACKRCINIPVKGTHRIRKTVISTLINNGVPISTASELAGHVDERTTIKNYLFDTDKEQEKKVSILKALGDTTISSESEIETVTNRDKNIILFPINKKAGNPYNKRISH